MKQSIIILLLAFTTAVHGQESFKAITLNIRYATTGDGVNQWENRKSAVIDFVLFEQPDVMGMQEALYAQVQYLEEHLPSYKRVGVGRDDGKQKGEFSPIFFNTLKYTLVDSGTFWLSLTPEKPSVGWDAALPRVCSWVILEDKLSKELVQVYNAHYDHVGEEARQKSSQVILRKSEEMEMADKVIIMGDFNLEPTAKAIQEFVQAGFKDSFEASERRFGPVGTYNAFKVTESHTRRIDYIFAKGFEPKTYKVESSVINGIFLSDHFPVVVTMEKKK